MLRADSNSRFVHVLATVGPGGYFGERSLVKQQTRYASAVVTSKRLRALCVTRAGFEAALGCPLEALVPDHYKLDPVEVHTALRRMRFFGRLSDEQLHQVVKSFQMASFSEGEYAVEQGELGDAFYIIESGRTRVSKQDENGNTHTLVELGAGQHFGELALIENAPRAATVTAIDGVTLLRHTITNC